MNGCSHNSFAPQRVLRQGDPLYPYLCIIVVNLLAKIVRCEVDNGQLEGIRLKRSVLVRSSLFFAENALYFWGVSVSHCSRLMSGIAQYCQASGQLVNFAKSNVLFSRNVSREVPRELANIGESCAKCGQLLGATY